MKNKIDVEFKSDYMSLCTLYEEKIENLRSAMEKSKKNNLKILFAGFVLAVLCLVFLYLGLNHYFLNWSRYLFFFCGILLVILVSRGLFSYANTSLYPDTLEKILDFYQEYLGGSICRIEKRGLFLYYYYENRDHVIRKGSLPVNKIEMRTDIDRDKVVIDEDRVFYYQCFSNQTKKEVEDGPENNRPVTVGEYMKSHNIEHIQNELGEELWDSTMGDIPWEYYNLVVLDDVNGDITATHFLKIRPDI